MDLLDGGVMSTEPIGGYATGNGFEHIESNMTHTVVGVDLNPHYLNVLQSRFAKKIQDLRLICEDLAACELESGSYDIVHCALTLEYDEPRHIIPELACWLSLNGTLVIVFQLPSEKSGKVSETK